MAFVVLGLLMLAPHTIYALNKQFEQTISLFYRASLGSLRSALNGLLERGEVEFDETVDNGRAKKVYRVTDAGRETFLAWLTAPIQGSDLETAALSKLFFLGLLPDAAMRRAVLDDIVARASSDLATLETVDAGLDAVEVPPQFAAVFRYQRATLAYGLGSHRFGRDFFTALRDAEEPDA